MINNDLKLLIIDDDVDIVRLFLENQQPDNNQLNQLIKLTINEGKVKCFSYLFSLPYYEQFISYYDLISYTSSSLNMELVHTICSNPSPEVYKYKEKYLYLLLAIIAQGGYEPIIPLLEQIYIGKFKTEELQGFLNEIFNTVLRNISQSPYYKGEFNPNSKDYFRVTSCLTALLELGAVFIPYKSQQIHPDLKIILDKLLLNQGLSQKLPQQDQEVKQKL